MSKADYHIHTKYSYDCDLEVSKIIEIALKKGLKEIAITDHNTIKGGMEAKRISQGKSIEVIVGAEIQTNCGEVIGLGLKEEIEERELSAVIKEIKRQGGKVLIPHPFGILRRNKLKNSLEELADDTDFIEVYNGRNFFNGYNKKAEEIAHKYGIGSTVGSDAHFSFEIGNTESSLLNWRGRLGFILTKLKKFLEGCHK